MTRLIKGESTGGVQKRGRSDELDEASFDIRINGRTARVAAATPFVNVRQLLGQAGVLLQDVTKEASPIVLLPCPRTGNVTVQPGRDYKLVKFVGEHVCLEGHISRINNGEDSNPSSNAKKKESKEERLPRISMWAMAELYALLTYLQHHPASCVQDFFSISAERMALYHSRGILQMKRQHLNAPDMESSDEELEEDEECCAEGSVQGDEDKGE